MAKNISSKLGVSEGFDFANEVRSIKISDLQPYHGHRFSLYEGEALEDMVQSVRVSGILQPILCRRINGGYEILAGHNRVNAAKCAGLEEVPAIVMNVTDDKAEIIAIESNLIQRGFDDLKLSEKAYAVAVRYDEMLDEKRKAVQEALYVMEHGKKPPKSEKSAEGEKSTESEKATDRMSKTAEEYAIGRNTVARLLRYNELNECFKILGDSGNLSLRAAVYISYLSPDAQEYIFGMLNMFGVEKVDEKMAKAFKKIAETAANPEELFETVLTGEYFEDDGKKKKDKPVKISCPKTAYNKYLKDKPKREINDIIEKALEMYFESVE